MGRGLNPTKVSGSNLALDRGALQTGQHKDGNFTTTAHSAGASNFSSDTTAVIAFLPGPKCPHQPVRVNLPRKSFSVSTARLM